MVYVLDIDTYIFIYIYMIYISFIRYMYMHVYAAMFKSPRKHRMDFALNSPRFPD